MPALLGARDDADVDFYVAATKVFLAGPFSRTWLVNATLRATRANQLGLLESGGDRKGSRGIDAELSAAVFLSDEIVAGAEHRQKPDNLSAFVEDDYWDLFAAWFPSKLFSVAAAYADLGQIAMKTGQHGLVPVAAGELVAGSRAHERAPSKEIFQRAASSARASRCKCLNPFGKQSYSSVRV